MTIGTQPFQIKLSSLLIWGLGLFWMLAMLSADFRDPTFFNPLYPAEGLHNWLSLPGALLGGSMIEIFGPVALLIPWLFVRIIIPPSGSAARWLLIYHALILLITSTTLYALSGFFFRLVVWIRNVALKARIPGRNFFDMAENSLGNFGWTSIFRSSLHL